ncbi:Metallo-dependent hydrolase [Crucibulum laeve]|uniref:Metallo-dependent hydrolase n=1 Tax=Crucibulum laeve TaxID=68775 RepID=A0A5C3MD12_9AGAR|nr:Metallo-dependent hydrolase [Crucibulum laeve]
MLFRGDFVHTPTLGTVEILEDYLLSLDEKGFISHFESTNTVDSLRLLGKGSPTTEIPKGSFVMPSFCDLHLHAPQFLYQGNGLDLPLMQWLENYTFKAEEKLDADPMLAKRVYTQLANRLIEAGTGSVLLFGTIKTETNLILAEVMQEAGIRAFVGKLSMDISSRPTYVEVSAEASLSAASSFADQCRLLVSHLPPSERRVEPVLTPRFVPTCSDEVLSGLGELSESKDLRIQSHLAEAHDQVEWVRSTRGAEDIDVFDRNHLLTPRTVQAHCTFLGSPDFTRLSSKGTSIAHCPLSNAYFSAKPFPLREALQEGVKVGLGTDIAGGYSVDIMNAMRNAVMVSRMREGSRIMTTTDTNTQSTNLAIDWKESLYLATRGGAIALDLPGTGVFKVGSSFDAQQLRIFYPESGKGVGPLDFLDLETNDSKRLNHEMVEKWWCNGDTRNRILMWVQGRVVLSRN